MIADAVHSLYDFVTDIVVMVLVRLSSKGEDNKYNYGHGKFETLATAVIVSVFILKVAYLLTKACLDELLEKTLPKEIENKIIETVLSFEEVNSLHHLRTRRIGKRYSIDVNVRMDGTMNLYEAHNISIDIENKLKKELKKEIFINIHMEPMKQQA